MTDQPQPLTNSRRGFPRVTLTPLVTAPPGAAERYGTLALTAQVRALAVTGTEIATLRTKLTTEPQKAAIDGIASLVGALSATAVLNAARALAAVPTQALVDVGKALADIRTDTGGGGPIIRAAPDDTDQRGHQVAKLFSEAVTRRELQPVSLLHLERLDMTPLAVERGELLYSLPLAPNEKVTLAHREWTTSEQEFTEFIQDRLENYSEKGVAESEDIAMSTLTETRHADALNPSQPIASATGVHLSSAVDATATTGSTVDSPVSKEESRIRSRAVTAAASSRTVKDHKVSFTVTTVSGMEDFTARLLENRNPDKSMHIDYFRRMRKWQCELYRYGVRLAYDVVLPDPGKRLRNRQVRLAEIDKILGTDFQLALRASDITVANWRQLADTYRTTLPAPPEAQRTEVSQPVEYPAPYDVVTTPDGKKWHDDERVVSLNFAVPPGYQLSKLDVFASVHMWDTGDKRWVTAVAGNSSTTVEADGNGYCNVSWSRTPPDVPAGGQIAVAFRMQAADNGVLRLTGSVAPTEATMFAWRDRCWSLIQDAALAQYQKVRDFLRGEQAALRQSIAADDKVRLRKLEREQIMRSVLEWLFPGFDDASSVLASLPSPGALDPGTWQQVMEYGEYIKFVQTAVDWENVIVYGYPYFWDTIWRHPEKQFLDHPDPQHREFLRAGAARVVLAIQPGYEEQVVSLLEQGQLGQISDGTRFKKAIADVRAANGAYAAATAQPAEVRTGRPGGGSPEPEPPRGVRIGRWTDYTPANALDMEVTFVRADLD